MAIQTVKSKSRIQKLLYRLSNESLIRSFISESGYPVSTVRYLEPILFFRALYLWPYILWVLIAERKYGWLSLFVTMIPLPIWIIITWVDEKYVWEIVIGSPLMMFYIYCWMLRIAIYEWLSD